MPYNTRRKSLSLPSLGIHIPTSHASRHRIPSNSSTASSSGASSPSSRADLPPAKKVKRSHGQDDDTEAPLPPAAPSVAATPTRSKPNDSKLDNTPPPSPGVDRASVEMEDAASPPVSRTVDLEGINDDIVEAVIVQLQNSNNKPHLVKELSNILMQSVKVVQQSANPCAIISSRLAAYLKRSCWSALAPCPLAKELETVHPRRTYFYLTTCPHPPLPDSSTARLAQRTIITPSLSSAASASEDADLDRRRELSPSPEVDLSSPEFDDLDDDMPMPSTPIGSLRLSGPLPRHHRGGSPPLEKDEKEFTQTADGLQKRKLSGDLMAAANLGSDPAESRMDLDDSMSRGDDVLFGETRSSLTINTTLQPASALTFVTSPAIRPNFALNLKRDGEAESWARLDGMLEWDRSPENIELDELDGLLLDF